MTTQQLLYLFCFYLGLMSIAIYFSRATARRIVGALVGGAISGLINFALLTLGETSGWWKVPIPWTPAFLLLLLFASAIAAAFVFLLTWRIERRFSGRGIAVAIVAAAIIGPPRSYLVAAVFPEWIAVAPGLMPVLAIAVTFALWVGVGHAVMRWIAGPAQQDQLARRRWATS